MSTLSPEQVDILLVDDQSAGLLSLEATLEPLGQRLHRAQSGREALRRLLDHDYALILLDVVMPGLDGFETARLVRERERSAQTPIIFLTALSDGALPRLRAYSMGAVDYLVKPFEPEVLRSKVSVFVELARKTALIEAQGRELQAAQTKAHERELARTREEFFAVALHELRTPLTSMGLQLHALKRWVVKAKEPLPPAEIQQRLVDVEQGMVRLNKLSDYLLDISRMREGRVVLERSTMDMGEVVQGVVDRITQERKEVGVELSFTVEGPMTGFWDRTRIEQIATNLVTNAVKYGGGKPVVVSVTGDDGQATLTVRDQGPGISREDQELLFHRFFRGRRSDADGFGLGLWIVQQLVALHEGRVSVKSELGQGSAFAVVLPKKLESVQPTPPTQSAQQPTATAAQASTS
jgi:signal transduction histidine kinase